MLDFRILALTSLLLGAPVLAGPGAGPMPEPAVIMEADPAPPFIYWAPEGATVKNHPRVDGVWIAVGQEPYPTSYYGDMCKASQFQKFLGDDLSRFPPTPEDAVWRFACNECAMLSDLQFERLNIMFDQETNLITSIACG